MVLVSLSDITELMKFSTDNEMFALWNLRSEWKNYTFRQFRKKYHEFLKYLLFELHSQSIEFRDCYLAHYTRIEQRNVINANDEDDFR